jgi:hypothetical protein
MHDQSRPTRSRAAAFGGWPAVIAIAVVIAVALYFTLARQERAAQLRVGSGTAQAMYDGTHTDEVKTAAQ